MLEGKKNKQTLKNVINSLIKNSNNQYEGKIIVTSVRGENPTTYTVKNGALEEAPLTRLRLEPQPDTNISRLNNIVKNEVMREQDSATPLKQTIEGTTRPERITSSFKFDTDTGKYYISGGVYDEIVEVMNSSFTIKNEETRKSVRQTATLATAFLTSLSEDTQDGLVRRSLVGTGDRFLTGGNERLLRLFFNMNEGRFKNQAEYLADSLDRLTPEAEDKVRKQSGVSAAESQMEQVRKRYYGTDKWMKAPNGKDTNLTERQWLQVRTENFKAWFGDWENDPQNASKVVDVNGEPKPVYHGSRSPRFNIFDSSNGDAFAETPEGSIWFTDSKEVALSYSSKSEEGLYEVFLNIRNPESCDWGFKPWTEINEEGYVIYDVNEYIDEGMVAYGDTIDGFVIENIAEDDFNDNSFSTDYVVFSPNQIKSATDNSGDFSSESDDIRYQAMSLSEEQKKYVELKKNIVLNYSDETQYTNVETPSKNVFVYTEHYENYENGIYSKHQRAVYEKELRAAEVFGNAGFSDYVLPEKFILAWQEYKGKVPDALMNGYLVEFKELETTKVGQFTKELDNAASKADILYLDSPVEMLDGSKGKESLYDVINGRVRESEKYTGKIIVTSVRGENATVYLVKNGTLETVPLSRLRLEPQPDTNISRLNNIVKNEVMREQDSATPLKQTIEATTRPERITSSFKFDTDTGKYYISGGVYDAIVLPDRERRESSFLYRNICFLKGRLLTSLKSRAAP